MHKEKAQIVEAKIVNEKVVIPKGWGSFVGTGKKGKSGKVHKKGVVYAIKLQVGGTKGAKRKKSPCSKKASKKAPASKKSKKAKKSGTRKTAKKTSRRKTSAWKNAPGGKMQYRTLASGHVEERAKPTRKGGKGKGRKSKKGGKGRKSKKTAEKGAKRGAKKSGKREVPADVREAMQTYKISENVARVQVGRNFAKGTSAAARKRAEAEWEKRFNSRPTTSSKSTPRKSTKKELARDSRRRHAKGSRKPTRKQAARAYAKRKASASKSLGAKAEANRFALMDAKMAKADAESRAKGHALADRAAKWKAQMKKWKAGK